MKPPTVRHTTAGLVHFEAHDACTMQPKDAREYASKISRAAIEAQRLQDKGSGRTEWTAVPVYADSSVSLATEYYLVTHMDTTRLFKRMVVGVSRRRRPPHKPCPRILGGSQAPYFRWRCAQCDVGLSPGSIAYAQTKGKPWEQPNWRQIRLCDRCVRPDCIGAALALDTVAEASRG